MASYSKWLTSKGLKSNAATGAQYRMSQGSDLTDDQYKKLGLTKGSDTMVDGVQTGTPAPDRATIVKAIHKYSQNLLKQHQRKAQTGALAAVKPKPSSNIERMKEALAGSLPKRPTPRPQEGPDDTIIKDASGNVISATGASAHLAPGSESPKDPGFSSRGGTSAPIGKKAWKPGLGNQNRALADAVRNMDWKKNPPKNRKGMDPKKQIMF